jgi:hypothetical protein
MQSLKLKPRARQVLSDISTGQANKGFRASDGYSRTTTIEGQALRSEDNGSLACSGLQTDSMERTPEKGASAEPSTQHGIEAAGFGVFAPPGSPLDRQSVMIFP